MTLSPIDVERDPDIDTNDKWFLIDYLRYMQDRFSVKISAASTFHVPDHTTITDGDFSHYPNLAENMTTYFIEVTQYIPGFTPITKVLKT